MLQHPQRRLTDNDQQDIEDLIAQENDPKIRLQLMVMNRINLSLIANTKTIEDVADKLDNHLEIYQQNTEQSEALINKGKGFWRATAFFLGLLQFIGAGLYYNFTNQVKELMEQENRNQVVHATMIERINELDQKVFPGKYIHENNN